MPAQEEGQNRSRPSSWEGRIWLCFGFAVLGYDAASCHVAAYERKPQVGIHAGEGLARRVSIACRTACGMPTRVQSFDRLAFDVYNLHVRRDAQAGLRSEDMAAELGAVEGRLVLF